MRQKRSDWMGDCDGVEDETHTKCDLQPGHGGEMHAGTYNGKLIWWDRSGQRIVWRPETAVAPAPDPSQGGIIWPDSRN